MFNWLGPTLYFFFATKHQITSLKKERCHDRLAKHTSLGATFPSAPLSLWGLKVYGVKPLVPEKT